jgi:hypothetical protein
MSDAILRSWMTLKDGDGIRRARCTSRILSLAALVLTVIVVFGVVRGGMPATLLVAMSISIGWLLAERNAIDLRRRQWPFVSRYIDWNRVQNDLERCDETRSS